MLTSNNCWMKDTCPRGKLPNSECKQKDAFCIKLFKLNQLYNDALVTMSQRQHINLRIDSDGTDREEFIKLADLEKHIKQFVDTGKNLYIHSETCGNGKTAWSLRLIQAYFSEIWAFSDITCRALFINVPRFLLALKDSISNQNDYVDHIKKYVLTADLVVWDDIATKANTPFEMEHLLSIINARFDTNKSNIFTSNIGSGELNAYVGDRLASRIIGFSYESIFHGQDKRRLSNDSTSIS